VEYIDENSISGLGWIKERFTVVQLINKLETKKGNNKSKVKSKTPTVITM